LTIRQSFGNPTAGQDSGPWAIFDFDGTLADSLDLIYSCALTIGRKHRLSYLPTRDEFYSLSSREMLLKRMKLSPLGQWIWSTRLRRELYRRWDEIALFPGIPELLRELAPHCKLGLLTLEEKRLVQRVLKKHGTDVFSHCFLKIGIFEKQRVLRRLPAVLGVDPRRIAVIGDEGERDIQPAASLGYPTIAVTWGKDSAARLASASPTHIVHTVADLQCCLKGLLHLP
jgi:phosphoglycolate phosphatase